jgi:hypothetical protein
VTGKLRNEKENGIGCGTSMKDKYKKEEKRRHAVECEWNRKKRKIIREKTRTVEESSASARIFFSKTFSYTLCRVLPA